MNDKANLRKEKKEVKVIDKERKIGRKQEILARIFIFIRLNAVAP